MKSLKIYIDRLKEGQTHSIQESLAPESMDLSDDELQFHEPIEISGEAYLADTHLVIQLHIKTTALLPCSICNDAVPVPIVMKNVYLTESLSDIKGAIYDCKEQVRETILLQAPQFAECNNGKCPERDDIKKFLKSEPKPRAPGETTHFPFADL